MTGDTCPVSIGSDVPCSSGRRHLNPEDRLAGLLILPYAQRAPAISRLTLDHLRDSGCEVRLRLTGSTSFCPSLSARWPRQVSAARHGHATIGDPGTSPWLFPGGQPGRPISAFRMAERLRQLGICSGPARSAALFQLATDLPAAVLARLLGIHIAVAVAWQRASAGTGRPTPPRSATGTPAASAPEYRTRHGDRRS